VGVARTPRAAPCWRRYCGALTDPGAPLGPAVTVSADGVRPGDADGRVSGYSVLQADDMDSAVALVRDHPFVTRGGSLQVTEAVSP
jgi:hypothetical protein